MTTEALRGALRQAIEQHGARVVAERAGIRDLQYVRDIAAGRRAGFSPKLIVFLAQAQPHE